MLEKTRVAVIYGGRSPEHSISCITARSIIKAMDPEKYEIFPVGITRTGRWTVGALDPVGVESLPEVSEENLEITLSLASATKGQFFSLTDASLVAEVDLIFPVMHGPYGEDGTIQGLFELSGIPYVGCGVLASATGMDKEFTKKLMQQAGIPITREVVLHAGEELSAKQLEYLGLPVFIKPARGGSSIGISKVNTAAELEAAIATAFEYDTKIVVEAEIKGSEIEVGVLQYPDGKILASVPAQLLGTADSTEGFYGFSAKYLDGQVAAAIPAQIPPAAAKEIQELAIKAFQAIDGTGIARVDFFLTPNGPLLNEINTLPGFTDISMYPKVFAATGITYPQLIETLIQTALAEKNKQKAGKL
ncbi:D-alanine--D-alanine ligase family protein [Corynebacterium caspium]|uniref:D-alanine--D-alanine ligase family protein n=1 Tax=Corynebacterium caspium TaxID=234828 RepID=UPI00036648B1|nr:D-alanine--D-alanine ligase family protein [Corynebacterium caspium]WKD59399.1 D-alanine--D-alanine ligase [Corynebacterium caspium DSM 44850]